MAADDPYQRAPSLANELGGGVPGAALRRLAGYFSLTWYVAAAARLGIADVLAKRQPLSCEEIASSIGGDAGMVFRLLRALASYDVFTEVSAGQFALTPLAECLRSDSTDYGWAALQWATSSVRVRSYSSLPEVVRTGKARARDYFADIEQDGGLAALFDVFQASVTAQNVPAFLAGYDFSPFHTLVDVGGGNGTLLAGILDACPEATGILLDVPEVVERVQPGPRMRVEAGSFFERIPAGADAYLLKYILHDWNDQDCQAILRVCRAAMRPDSRLLVFEVLLPGPGNAPSPAKPSDLLMKLNNDGQERTGDEYAALLERAGLRLTEVIPTEGTFSILEAAPIG